VQNGMMLTLLGLLWRHLCLTARIERIAAVASVFALYTIWIGLLLAAAFGTSRATPMAGAGHSGAPWQEALVNVVFGAGSVALLLALGVVLWGLGPLQPRSE
jgi:hydroxylaminobenzene mutase